MSDISLQFVKALEENNYELCRSMCENYSSYVNILIYRSQTPLMLASQNGSLDIVLLLLDYGADVNKGNGFGLTPLMISALYNHINIMNELIIHGADINSTNFYGMNALMMACSNGHFHCVDLLLKQPSIIIDAQDKLNKNTALHQAIMKKKFKIADLLIANHADFSLYNKKDETSLFLIEKNNNQSAPIKTMPFYSECR
jgi:ankyrin repeat protein